MNYYDEYDYLYYYLYSYLNSREGQQLLGILFVAVAAVAIASLVVMVLKIVACWNIFRKAGQPGWKALIPFYNTYIMYKIAWRPAMFWVGAFLPSVLYLVSSVIVGVNGGYYVTGVQNYGILGLGFLLMSCAGIASLVINILLCIKLSHAFGHGGGYAVGLIFLTTIFQMILGFGRSQYVGNYRTMGNGQGPTGFPPQYPYGGGQPYPQQPYGGQPPYYGQPQQQPMPPTPPVQQPVQPVQQPAEQPAPPTEPEHPQEP